MFKKIIVKKNRNESNVYSFLILLNDTDPTAINIKSNTKIGFPVGCIVT